MNGSAVSLWNLFLSAVIVLGIVTALVFYIRSYRKKSKRRQQPRR